MANTGIGYLAIKKQSTREVAVKPTNFLRYKNGDLMQSFENIVNNPIQNNKWNNLQLLKGKAEPAGDIGFDFDFNESIFLLYGVLGAISSSDISSATDGSVYRHTITVANTLPAFSIEQAKGDIADTTSNRQKHMVNRGFGCLIDSIAIAASDRIVSIKAVIKMLGIFDSSFLEDDAAAGSTVDLALETVEGLTTDDTVNIYDETPQNETDAVAAIDTTAKTIEIATLGNSYTVANRAKVELTPQTPSYGTAEQVAIFHDCKFQFADAIGDTGSAAEVSIEDWEMTIENQTKSRHGSKRQWPGTLAEWRGRGKLTFKLFFETKAEYDKYKSQKKEALMITINNGRIISSTDTNNAKFQTQIKLPAIGYTEYELPTTEDDVYGISAAVEILYDDTAGYAVQFVSENGKAGTYYTA